VTLVVVVVYSTYYERCNGWAVGAVEVELHEDLTVTLRFKSWTGEQRLKKHSENCRTE